jgi:uncharacterized protein
MSSSAVSTPVRATPSAARLPGALLDPGAFPHRPDHVELRETHISWVFLAGDRAYKVKKPVALPFLDYGTLQRRRTCCDEEVQINRRAAPSVYVGLVALVPHGPAGLVVSHEHDPRAVEYAVEMRRYDERATLAAMLEDGRATEGDLRAIGGRLAHFHLRLAPKTSGEGTDRLAEVVEETLATLARAAAGLIAPSRLAALARFARAGLDGFGPQLEARDAAGLVRDGHGDLRAEHILLGDRMEMVDALDFDPTLRVADVAYDLAFLVMDVARRDEGLARALVRGYTAGGGDAGGERLLAFLVVVRALVRAKIDLLRADQLAGADRDERVQRADGLLALAERFAWRARLPRVACVGGLAASGKSTLAAAVSSASGLPVFSSDLVRKAHAGLEPNDRAAQATYDREVSREVYDALGRAAAGATRTDGGAIVDATFRHPDDVAAFQAASSAANRAEWIVCHAPAEVLLERARRRTALGSTASDADPEIVGAQIRRLSGPLPLPRPPLVELDTVRAVPQLLDELAAALDARLARS